MRWFNRLLALPEYSSRRTSRFHEILRVTELINPTFFTLLPAQEYRYWDNCVLNAIVNVEHLCYDNLINGSLSLRPWRYPRVWTNLNLGRLVMDILQLSLFDDNDNNVGKKQCNVCLKCFDNTPEFWHRNSKGRNGLLSVCKVCNNEKVRQYRKNNREKVIESQKRYEQIHKEEINKYRKQYYQANRDKRVEYARQWRKDNKEIGLQWRKNNRERISKRRKKYLEDNKEHISRRYKLYYAENREHIVEVSKQWNRDNHERISALRRQYLQTPAGIFSKRARAHNRRALKKKAGGKHTSAQLRELYSKQEGKCFYCKVELGFSRNSWHADHTVPLSRGGSNDISNIVISCPKCNLEKSNKLIHEWMGGRKDEGESEQKQTS